MILPRTSVFGYWEYLVDPGYINNLGDTTDFTKETLWKAGIEYMLSKDLSLMAVYDKRFGGGLGLSGKF